MPVIDEILNVLKNGEWHGLVEISEKTGLNGLKVKLVTNFLAEYNFIELDAKEKRTRLTSELLNFIRKIQSVEEKERQQRVS